MLPGQQDAKSVSGTIPEIPGQLASMYESEEIAWC